MLSYISPYFATVKLLPSNGDKLPEDDVPEFFERFQMGPFNITTLGVKRNLCMMHPGYQDKIVDRISKVRVREYNSIDALGFFSKAGEESFIGNPMEEKRLFLSYLKINIWLEWTF